MGPLDDLTIFRAYELLGPDGYPPAWHATIKHAVRDAAGNRCVRCGHPYERGAGEWSPCDEVCMHGGEVRYGDEIAMASETLPGGITAGAVVAEWELCEARWRILTVHHLDGDKGNCRWWNLASLCQRCHLVIQGKVRMERRWLHAHSEWFRPYVAGFYAFTFLGEDLTRGQVDGRLDELLALEERQLALSLPAAVAEAAPVADPGRARAPGPNEEGAHDRSPA